MNTLLLSLMLAFVPWHAVPQAPSEYQFEINPDRTYWFNMREVNLDSRLHRFEILMTVAYSDDIFDQWLVFIGTYAQKGRTIYFTDTKTGAKMTAVAQGDSLNFIRAPKFLTEFKYETPSFAEYLPQKYKRYKTPEDFAKRREELRQDDFEGSLYSAYRYLNAGGIAFNSDHTYVFQVNEAVLSRGRWSRKGNIVTMTDADIDANYYAVVWGRELIPLPMPIYDMGNLAAGTPDNDY